MRQNLNFGGEHLKSRGNVRLIDGEITASDSEKGGGRLNPPAIERQGSTFVGDCRLHYDKTSQYIDLITRSMLPVLYRNNAIILAVPSCV